MRVAIDATPLVLSSGGIARYTSELTKALAESFPEDEFALISDQKFPVPPRRFPNLRCVQGPQNLTGRRWWLSGAQQEMSRQRSDLFHGTHFLVPWLPLRPGVSTIHDLSPWRDVSWQPQAGFVRRRFPLVAGLGIATMYLTPSDAVRRQAIERFRIHPARIIAVPLAAAPEFRPVPTAPDSIPYFLFCGTLEPRKNLEMLVTAWREVRKSREVRLVLAGRRRFDGPAFEAAPGLRILGEVPDEELPSLYSRALACVYPSLYEGFGLPVLEAMQCGAAVIASRDPAVQEAAGDAALLLDARDTKAWVDAMAMFATRPDQREFWRERSLARAGAFSWQRTACRTREVYEEAIRRFRG